MSKQPNLWMVQPAFKAYAMMNGSNLPEWVDSTVIVPLLAKSEMNRRAIGLEGQLARMLANQLVSSDYQKVLFNLIYLSDPIRLGQWAKEINALDQDDANQCIFLMTYAVDASVAIQVLSAMIDHLAADRRAYALSFYLKKSSGQVWLKSAFFRQVFLGTLDELLEAGEITIETHQEAIEHALVNYISNWEWKDTNQDFKTIVEDEPEVGDVWHFLSALKDDPLSVILGKIIIKKEPFNFAVLEQSFYGLSNLVQYWTRIDQTYRWRNALAAHFDQIIGPDQITFKEYQEYRSFLYLWDASDAYFKILRVIWNRWLGKFNGIPPLPAPVNEIKAAILAPVDLSYEQESDELVSIVDALLKLVDESHFSPFDKTQLYKVARNCIRRGAQPLPSLAPALEKLDAIFED